MFSDCRSLLDSFAAIRSTDQISADLPSPAVLLQSRHLRGSLSFLPKNFTHQLVPAEFVLRQLQRRQTLLGPDCRPARSCPHLGTVVAGHYPIGMHDT